MMQRISFLVYIDSQMYKLTIRMHFDQFIAVQKGNFYFFYHPPHFQHCLTMHTFKRKILKSQQHFPNIFVYNCRPNTHLPNPTNGFSVTAHAELIFEKLLASCIRYFILCLVVNFWVRSPRWPNMPFCQQIFLEHSHNISKWHSRSRGGTGSTKQKTLKNSLTVYEKKRF